MAKSRVIGPREMDLRKRAREAAEALTGERACLLRAIIDAPADDAPRLVYADWLDEHGFPGLAELIRAQCDPCFRPGADPVPPADYPWSGGHEEEYEDLLSALLLKRDKLRHRAFILGRSAAVRSAWGPFPESTSFLLSEPERGFPTLAQFRTLKHCLRWATALGAWVPVCQVLAGGRWPLSNERDGIYWWQEDDADWDAGPQWSAASSLPTRVFRFLPGLPADPFQTPLTPNVGRRWGYVNSWRAEAAFQEAVVAYVRQAAREPEKSV